jgi:ABC-2 type transport system permease protein
VITLVSTEVRRALARRLVKVLALVALAAMVFVAILILVNSQPNDPDAFGPDDVWSSDPDEGGVVRAGSILFLLFSLLAGASFVGAEYKAGTITGLLTWEPRRLRVLAAKLAAAAIVAGGIFVVFEVLLALVLAGVVVVRGTGWEQLEGGFYGGLAGYLGRGAFVMGGLAVLGACIATLGRNTTAALGAVLGYLVVVESVVRGFRPGWDSWYLIENLFIALDGHRIDDVTRSVPGSALVLLGYLAVVVAGAAAVFARRDVT